MHPLASWRRYLPVVILLAATAALLATRNLKENIPSYEDLVSFPKEVGDWHGNSIPMDPDSLAVLGPGQFLMRDYQRSPFEPAVNLFLAYFPSQRAGDTIHSPQHCLPGFGWTPVESTRISFQRKDGSSIMINRYVVTKGTDRKLVFYWYQAHGRVTPSEYWAKIYLVTDAIRLNRTDGALVRIVAPILRVNDDAVTQAKALDFAQHLMPLLDSYIPR